MIERINTAGGPVVAVDVPSGVNASTGEVPGAAVRATVTVTFGAAKVGLAVAPGRFHAGSVHVAPIGLALAGHEHALVAATVLGEVPRKTSESTKYRAGSVLVVGGSPGLTGAPMLTALAAFRADAGYVTVAAPESALPALEARLLEAVKRPLPEDSSGRLVPRAADARAGGGRAGRRRRARARPRPHRGHARAGAHPARAARGAGRPRRRRALGARAVRARRADGPHAALGRARAPARRRGA